LITNKSLIVASSWSHFYLLFTTSIIQFVKQLLHNMGFQSKKASELTRMATQVKENEIPANSVHRRYK